MMLMLHVEWIDYAGRHQGPERNSTGCQFDLRELRHQIDPEWIPITEISMWAEGVRVIRYTWADNDEDLSCPRLWDLASRSLRDEWNRLVKAIRIEMGRRRAASYLHQVHLDQDAGGVLTPDDLIEEGLLPGTIKSRPGYWPRAERPLAECLELYSGAYGVGLIEHQPRYDTSNYHYVRYWLYELGELLPIV